jgi:putative inorganic carbon (hco3(-)) transporter
MSAAAGGARRALGVLFAGLAFASGMALFWERMPIAEAPLLVAGSLIGLVIAIRAPLIPCLVCVGIVGFRIQDAFPVLYPFRLPLVTSAWAAIALVAAVFTGKANFQLPRSFQWMIAFVIITSISIVFAIDPGRGWDYFGESYIKILIVIITFLFVVRDARDIATIHLAIVLFGMMIASVAITNKLEGIDLVEGSRVTIGREQIGSPLSDPNDLALILMVPLSFAIALVIYGRRFQIMLGALGTAAIFTAILLTQSRGGVFGIMALSAVFGSRLIKSKIVLIAVGLIGGAAIYLAMGIGDRSVSSSLGAGLDESAEARLNLWIVAIRTFIANPLLGIGMENFPIVAAIHTGLAFPTHNTWLQVAAETGLLGLIAFGGMVAAAIRAAAGTATFWDRQGTQGSLHAAALACFAALMGFCASSSFITHGFTWTIYFLVCLSAVTRRASEPWMAPPARHAPPFIASG